MSNAAKPKGPRQLPPSASPATWAGTYLASTVGSKILVAITGTLLIGFVVFHMIGNMKLLFGREEFNAYAHFLKHSLGPLLWMARAGLLAVFLAHIGLALRLRGKSAAARPVPYLNPQPAQATLSSRTMLLTGLVIGAFTVFHLAHYTFGWVPAAQNPDGTWTDYFHLKDDQNRHDVYSMVVAGFRTPWLVAVYLVAQAILLAHLSHGVQSVVQTLGLKGTKFGPVWTTIGLGTAAFVVLGNVAIVVAVFAGLVPPVVATRPM